jgi:hypothetical protein
MKLLGNLVLVLSLTVGVLSAATAYQVPIDSLRVEPDQEPLTLNADAGEVILQEELPLAVAQERVPLLAAQQTLSPFPSFFPILEAISLAQDPYAHRALSRLSGAQVAEANYDTVTGQVRLKDKSVVPLFRKKDQLSEAVIRALWNNHYKNVGRGHLGPNLGRQAIVQEFSLTRWRGKWAFAGAVLGLLVGAVLLRSASRRAIASVEGTGMAELPEQALRAIKETIEGLRRERAGLGVILDRVGELQKTHMLAFVEARPALISRLGLGGYAELMDRYAAAERQINRAWSAAADGVHEEAVSCLDLAAVYLEEAQGRLQSRS